MVKQRLWTGIRTGNCVGNKKVKKSESKDLGWLGFNIVKDKKKLLREEI